MSDGRARQGSFVVYNRSTADWSGCLDTGATVYGWVGCLYRTRERCEQNRVSNLRLLVAMGFGLAVASPLEASYDLFVRHVFNGIDIVLLAYAVLSFWMGCACLRWLRVPLKSVVAYRVVVGGVRAVKLEPIPVEAV